MLVCSLRAGITRHVFADNKSCYCVNFTTHSKVTKNASIPLGRIAIARAANNTGDFMLPGVVRLFAVQCLRMSSYPGQCAVYKTPKQREEKHYSNLTKPNLI